MEKLNKKQIYNEIQKIRNKQCFKKVNINSDKKTLIQTLKSMAGEIPIAPVAPVAPVARKKSKPRPKQRDLETEYVDIMELINENDTDDQIINDKFAMSSDLKQSKAFKKQLNKLTKERGVLLSKKREILSLMNK